MSEMDVRPSERRTYSVDEVARLLGISRTTAYECIHRGEIPARRFGRRVVVLRHELDAVLGTVHEKEVATRV